MTETFKTSVGSGSEKVGDILRETRLSYGLTLEQISNLTHIQIKHLKAIEEGRQQDLPNHTYVLGFVRSYAGYLGLNADEMVAAYKAEAVTGRAPPELSMASRVDSETYLSSKWLSLMCVISLVLMFLSANFLSQNKVENIIKIPPVPADLQARLAETSELLEAVKAEEEKQQQRQEEVRLEENIGDLDIPLDSKPVKAYLGEIPKEETVDQ